MSEFKQPYQLTEEILSVASNNTQISSQRTSIENAGNNDMFWQFAIEKLKVNEKLTKVLGRGNRALSEFKIWIEPLLLISCAQGEITLQCPTSFHDSWLEERGYKKLIEQALWQSGFPRDWNINYRYNSEQHPSQQVSTKQEEDKSRNANVEPGNEEKSSGKKITKIIEDLKSKYLKRGKEFIDEIHAVSMSLVAQMGGITLHDREEIEKICPGLVQIIEKEGNLGVIKYFLEYREPLSEIAAKINIKEDEKEKIKQPAKKIISKKRILCAFATDLTRTSPFVPLSKDQLKIREFLQGVTICKGPWGEVKQWGPQLCITEEDYLISLSSFMQERNNSHVETSYILEEFLQEKSIMRIYDETYFKEHQNDESLIGKFRKTLTYKGPLRPIIQRVMNSQANPSRQSYDRAMVSLKLLSVTGLELSISTGKGKPRRYNKIRTILTNLDWDDSDNVGNRLTVTIDPFFYLAFIHRKEHILMNVSERMQLSSPISKGLHRFSTSHRAKYEGPYQIVARAINLNANLPAKEQRRLLRESCDDLIQHGILTSDSGLPRRSDVITLKRVK